jgi:OOP family OmpA-OmpF porin
MNARIITLLLALCLALPAAWAQEANRATRQRIEDLQRRAEQALAGQSGVGLYRPAKALAWLDFALDELYEEDRTGIVEDSIAEAEHLLEAETVEAAFETPTPRGTERVREDLWTKAAELRKSRHFPCAAREIAQLEVQLVWAGHEKWESGWTHARPAVEVAENLVYDAEMSQRACASGPAPNVEKVSLSGEALFPFGKAGIAQLAAEERAKLKAFANDLKQWKSVVRIDVVGHTDRLGKPAYNDKLSRQRAKNVRLYLIAQGLPAERIVASGRGERMPLVSCRNVAGRKALVDCLQANRRVEITVRGER